MKRQVLAVVGVGLACLAILPFVVIGDGKGDWIRLQKHQERASRLTGQSEVAYPVRPWKGTQREGRRSGGADADTLASRDGADGAEGSEGADGEASPPSRKKKTKKRGGARPRGHGQARRDEFDEGSGGKLHSANEGSFRRHGAGDGGKGEARSGEGVAAGGSGEDSAGGEDAAERGGAQGGRRASRPPRLERLLHHGGPRRKGGRHLPRSKHPSRRSDPHAEKPDRGGGDAEHLEVEGGSGGRGEEQSSSSSSSSSSSGSQQELRQDGGHAAHRGGGAAMQVEREVEEVVKGQGSAAASAEGEAGGSSGGGGADPTPPTPQGKKHAHFVVVGNEKYVDGALVMGWSLSKYKKPGQAMVCLVTQGKVDPRSMSRLRSVGWDRVIAVDSMSRRVSKSLWKDSFVKLHIFNYTEYSRIAYWDSDMVVSEDPSSVFSLPLPEEEPHVIAIGSTPSKKHTSYFQTGMMVYRPTPQMHREIWGMFERGLKTKYNSYNGRDGALLREYFGSRYSSLPGKFSRNIDPRKKISKVIGVHYRGGYKPWFNRAKPMQRRIKRANPALDDTRKDFGFAYFLWWRLNEEMQRARFQDEVWGDDVAGIEQSATCAEEEVVPVSPKTHMHMLRYTEEAYLQAYSDVIASRRDVVYSGVGVHRASGFGQSCTDFCKSRGEVCHKASLNTSRLNSCAVLRSFAVREVATPDGGSASIECGACEPGIYTKQRKGGVYPGIVLIRKKAHGKHPDHDDRAQPVEGVQCTYHALLDERGPPSCDDSDSDTVRVCPCAADSAALEPSKWDGSLPGKTGGGAEE